MEKRPSCAPLDPDPARSFTLPAWFYTDADIFERERAAIFYRGWHFVAHRTELAEPGAFATASIAGQSLFVIRGKDGALRGFYNVCQHRAHELLKGRGRARVITCPYHAWSYHADGRLRSARGCEQVAGFDRRQFGLKPVRVEEFRGLVFANLDPAARGLAESAPGLGADIDRYFPDLASYVRIGEIVHDMAMNWKVRIDNSLECYHCETVHRSFSRIVDLDRYRVSDHAGWSRHHGRLRGAAGGRGPSGIEPDHYLYWYLWPLTEFNALTRYPMFSVFADRPLRPDRTEMRLQIYAPPDLPAEERQQIVAAWLDNETNAEDIALGESVQRGLGSRGYVQGRFIVDDTHASEHSVHNFHRLVAAALES